MMRSVTIVENGRTGTVRYTEGLHTIDGYWEFGGADVVAIVSMGTREEWQRAHAWAVGQRAGILRFVADEVVRQRAPSCTAEIDEQRGEVLLRQVGAAGPSPQAKAQTFVRRYSKLKAMAGIAVLLGALIIGGVMWFGKKALSVAPASGVPLGECVRTSSHIASLIQRTDPHLPNWSGRGGNETTSISILLITLDGSGPHMVPVIGGLSSGSYSLARILGSDGRTLWVDATGLFGVRLSDHQLITPEDLRKANPSLDPAWWNDPRGIDIVDGKLHIMNADRSAAVDVDPATGKATSVAPKPSNARFERHAPTDHLAAGFITANGSWLGLHSPEELEGGFKEKSWIKPVESAEDAKRMRRLCRAELETSSEGDHFRIRSIAPIADTEFLNAAFLRMDDRSAPLRLKDPDGALMIHTDKPGLGGRLIVSRVNAQGTIIWSVDTGLDRFQLQQILPGGDVFAFVGTRPPVEGKLSEPLVVLVENNTGKMTGHSLWR